MRITGPLAGIAAAALALTLSGCSGDGGGELTYEDSPLGQYLASAYGGDLSAEEQQKMWDEQLRAQEALMAECMAEQGFEYTPNVQSSGVVAADEEIEWEPEKKEWVEKYGYGLVNDPYTELGEDSSSEEYVDPNQEYIDSLSESEQAAYYETAYGMSPDEEALDEEGVAEYTWEDAGCQGWAQHEQQGEDPWQSDEFADLRTKMEELWSSTQESPEFTELNAAWASCMDDAGEPGFSVQTDAQQTIAEEQSALYEAAAGDGAAEGDAGAAEGDAGATEGDAGATEGDAPIAEDADPSSSPEMKALGEREIELALIDLDCRTETSYVEKSLKIQFALEEKFIAENKADLEAFKAAAEQNG